VGPSSLGWVAVLVGMAALASLCAALLLSLRRARARLVLAQRAVEEATRERDTAVATIAHDLKGPLTVIQGNAALLVRQARAGASSPSPRQLERYERICAASRRLAGQLDDVVDGMHDRPDVGLRVPTDLVTVCREIFEDLQPLARRHDLRLDTSEAQLIGDWCAQRVRRVLYNLVENAIKYSPMGGCVTVALRREAGVGGDWAVVMVADEGLGIPAADLPHVFELFRRGRNVGAIGGSGVGLSGARRIVEQHGGSIDLRSRQGAGSTVTVRLPLAAAGVVLAPRSTGVSLAHAVS
jgi:signal transduction histidine kinase